MNLHFLRSRPLRTACLTLALAGLALLPLAFSGCAKKEAKAASEGEKKEVEVVTINPMRKDLTREIDQPGFLKAYYETAIYTKIPGFAKEPKVDIGDWVKEGQLLLELDVPEVDQELVTRDAKVVQAEADLEQSKRARDAAKAGMAAAKADVDAKAASILSAKAQVKRWMAEDVRSQDLLVKKVYDRQTADEVINLLEASKAAEQEAVAKWHASEQTAEQAEAQYYKSEADIKVADARVKVAKADRAFWEKWLSYAKIRAPFDGVITERHVNTQDFLQSANSGSTSKSAKPVFTVMKTDVMRMTIQIPELDAGLVNTGDLRGYDVRLMPSLSEVSAMPHNAHSLIIVSEVKGVLYFRVFAENGKMIVDTDEAKVLEDPMPELSHQLDQLRAQLKTLWPPHQLTRVEKGDVITAVTNLVSRTQLGDTATITFQAKAGVVPITEGKITRGSYALDDRSRTLTVEVYLNNPTGLLQPGMYANVNIKAKLYHAWALPAEAIMSDILADGDRDYCYLVEDGKIQKWFLQTGARCDEGVQVLRKQRAGEKTWQKITGKEVVVTEPKKPENGEPAKQVGPKALLDEQAVVVAKDQAAP
jgi:multidrug efflux pump subunit AcrA (membrane-fusion protein)